MVSQDVARNNPSSVCGAPLFNGGIGSPHAALLNGLLPCPAVASSIPFSHGADDAAPLHA